LLGDEEGELQDELIEASVMEDEHELLLLLDSSLEHGLLDEEEHEIAADQLLLELLLDSEFIDELQLDDKHDPDVRLGLLLEELDDWDVSELEQLDEVIGSEELHDGELLQLVLERELSDVEKDDEELDPLMLLEQLLELLIESEFSDKEDDEELTDLELLLGLNELELELRLLSLKLKELEQQLSLRSEEHGELEEEDFDLTLEDEYEQLLLLLSWLEHWLLDEHDDGTDVEKQLEELLEE
jgi:hypothetical protein